MDAYLDEYNDQKGHESNPHKRVSDDNGVGDFIGADYLRGQPGKSGHGQR